MKLALTRMGTAAVASCKAYMQMEVWARVQAFVGCCAEQGGGGGAGGSKGVRAWGWRLSSEVSFGGVEIATVAPCMTHLSMGDEGGGFEARGPLSW